MTRRFLVGALAIVVLSGAGTAAFALGEVNKVVEALRQHKQVKVSHAILAPTSKGEPETLLLVGNDERPKPKNNPYSGAVLPHSNEMLLVRIDPSKPTISMMSIPRELWVPIHKPDGEVEDNRINSAYTFGYINGGGTSGGVKLMVSTIKEVLGIPTINYVFVTNFKRFEHAVQEMGCVYMTVDKRYYHNNEEPGAEQYMDINLRPGYQKLCGMEAREYVSNRHESTSLVRDARDQRFLLEAKAQYGPTLFEERERFEHIFGKAIETNLHGEEEVLSLLELLIESAGKPVRQVHFNATLGTEDTATPQQIHEALHSFLTGTAAVPRQRINAAPAGTNGHGGRASGAHRGSPSGSALTALSLSPTPSATLAEARAQASGLPFALEAPQYQDATAESSPDELRLYRIQGPHHRQYPAYVIVVGQVGLGQYYDVQGTSWTEPPLLGGTSVQDKIGRRTYSLHYDGEHLKTIAWRDGPAVYWIENTLNYALSPEQMVAIARETKPVTNQVVHQASEGTVPPPLRDRNIPTPASAAGETETIKLGDYLGFAVLLAAALLLAMVLMRSRELRRLRDQVAEAMATEARTRSAGLP
ncbi:MAG: LCP family protein [Acidobacteriota bacterium]|nr:LCP family protein [Acidobacteriota bacterium]